MLARCPRWLTALIVGSLAVAGTTACYPGGLVMAFDDLYHQQHQTVILKDYESKNRDLDMEIIGVTERLQEKEHLAAEWLAGKKQFIDLLNRFSELNGSNERFLKLQRTQYGLNCTERELMSMNVVNYLQQRIKHVPQDYLNRERLEREYQAEFGHGPLRMSQ